MKKTWKVGDQGAYPIDFGYTHIVELNKWQVMELLQRFVPEVKIHSVGNINDCVRRDVNLDNEFLNKSFVAILPGNIAVYKHDDKWILIQLGK